MKGGKKKECVLLSLFYWYILQKVQVWAGPKVMYSIIHPQYFHLNNNNNNKYKEKEEELYVCTLTPSEKSYCFKTI